MESLAVAGPAEMLQGAVLPAQLAQLHYGNIKSGSSLTALMSLQQLQYLILELRDAAAGRHNMLLQLQQLPALRHLTLQYEWPTAAVASAPVWAQLPQLRALHFLCRHHEREPSRHEKAVILPSIKAAASLTQVLVAGSRDTRWAEKVAVCCRLAGLTSTSCVNVPAIQCDPSLQDAARSVVVTQGVVFERPSA